MIKPGPVTMNGTYLWPPVSRSLPTAIRALDRFQADYPAYTATVRETLVAFLLSGGSPYMRLYALPYWVGAAQIRARWRPSKDICMQN